jgi:hypothetical protein
MHNELNLESSSEEEDETVNDSIRGSSSSENED